MLLGLSNRAPGPYVHVHLMAIEARHIWSGINAPTFPFCFATGVGFLCWGWAQVKYCIWSRWLCYGIGLEVISTKAEAWQCLRFRVPRRAGPRSVSFWWVGGYYFCSGMSRQSAMLSQPYFSAAVYSVRTL